MPVLNPNSAEVLSGEILADARRECEDILGRARQQAESLLAKAGVEAGKLFEERLAQARDEAARRSELILATVPLETARLRSARVEALLRSIRDEVHRRLAACEGFDYREVIIALAAEAVGKMDGGQFTVKLSPADCLVLGDGLAEAITRRVGRPALRVRIAEEPAIKGGGLIVEDAEGRQAWDNRFAARLNRLWPELRRQIAVETSILAGRAPGGGP